MDFGRTGWLFDWVVQLLVGLGGSRIRFSICDENLVDVEFGRFEMLISVAGLPLLDFRCWVAELSY